MSPRERTTTVRCAEAGCRETSFFTYSSQREYGEIMREQQRRPFRCTRHRNPDQVLGLDNLERTHVLVAVKVPFKGRLSGGKEFLDGLFWKAEGAERAGSGFEFGPGFKAFARDFPEGARLVVTARIELPEQPPVEAEDSDECTACCRTTDDLWIDPGPRPTPGQYCRACASDKFDLGEVQP